MMVAWRFVVPWTLKQRNTHSESFGQGLTTTVVNLLFPWSVQFLYIKGWYESSEKSRYKLSNTKLSYENRITHNSRETTER